MITNLMTFMMDERNFDKIDEFLENSLEGEELEDFERELRLDFELRKECEFRKDVNDAITETDVMDLRQTLSEIVTESYIKPKSSVFKRYIHYWAAASIFIVFSIGYFLIANNSVSDQELFDQYYKPYNVVINKRSASFSTNHVLQKAMFYYEAKNYDKALSLFTKVLEKDSTDVTGNFYSGISKIEVKRFGDANSNFERVINHKNNFFIEQSQWYLGFCYLMTNNRNKAIDQFKKISEGSSFYKNKAKEILEKIE